MKKLIIVGAGGFGREVLSWVKDGLKNQDFIVGGFVDDLSTGDIAGLQVISNINDYSPMENDVVAIAIADSLQREIVSVNLAAKGAVFANIIHHSCNIASTATIGKGLIACPGSLISNNAALGDFIILNAYSCVGHDAVIGDFTTVSSFCDITGNVKVGKSVFLGSRVSVLPGNTIGDSSTVGAGSVVMRNVPAKKTVFGNPARLIN